MRMILVATLLINLTACAASNKKEATNDSSVLPIPSSVKSGELADDTKIYGLNSQLNFVINREIKQSSLNYLQDNQWTPKPIWT